MLITNNYKLPVPVYDRIVKDNSEPPKEDVFRVTSLIGAPFKRRMLIEHWNDLVLDASEFIWTFFGHSLHYALSERQIDNALTEERVEIHVDGVTVTGQADLFRNGVISDYKTTSTWTVVYGRSEWEEQLNVYAWLFRRLGFEVNQLLIHAFLRDWSKKMQYDPDKPNIPYHRQDIPLWTFDAQEEYVRARISLHKSANIPPCSAEDMWEKPTTYKIKKKNVKKAVKASYYEDGEKKLITDPAMAELILAEYDSKHYIETCEGARICCQDYCPVRGACPNNIYRGQEDGIRTAVAC